MTHPPALPRSFRPALLRLIAAGLALVLAFLALALAPALQAQSFPALSGRVVDAANLLTAEQKSALDGKLAALEQQSQRQLVVVTIPDLGGYDIADYGFRLGDHWGIGNKDRDDGALLIVAPKERKVRIEVGYGLEGVMTDALSARIIRNNIIPHFRENDFPGGIDAGVDAIVKLLLLPPDEARKLAEQAQKDAQSSGGGAEMGIVILFILLFFVLPMFLGGKGGRAYRRGAWPVILWGAGLGSGSGGGGRSRSGGGGWSSGGGFSGGGGGFGGGGASGGW
ncbi:MAG: YgcG family protein [Sphingobium sp.]